MRIRNILILCTAFMISGIIAPIGMNAQKVEMDKGVRKVHNEKPILGKNSGIKLELNRILGGLDATDDNFMLYLPSDLVKDAEGNIYVLDAGNFRVQKYDSEGRFKLSFGREGRGPGEFSMVQSINLGLDDKLYIFDQSSSLMHIFDKNGKFDESFRPQQPMATFAQLPSGEYVVSAMGGMMMMGGGGGDPRARIANLQKSKADAMPLLKIVDKKGALVREFGAAKEYGEGFSNRFGNGFSMSTGTDGTIYLAFTYQNRIDKYSPDGELLMQIDRPLNFEESEAKADVNVDDGGPENMRIMIRAPQMNSISRAIGVDGDGRIWVVTNRRQLKDDERVGMSVSVTDDGSGRRMSMQPSGNTDVVETDAFEFNIFDKDGILLTTIPLTHFVDSMKIYGDKLYIIDRMRGMQIFEYRIVER